MIVEAYSGLKEHFFDSIFSQREERKKIYAIVFTCIFVEEQLWVLLWKDVENMTFFRGRGFKFVLLAHFTALATLVLKWMDNMRQLCSHYRRYELAAYARLTWISVIMLKFKTQFEPSPISSSAETPLSYVWRCKKQDVTTQKINI